jgi:hypothetical protein
MEAEPSDRNDGATAQPPLTESDKEALKTQLNLSPEQEKELSALSPELRDAWFEVVRSWNAPAARLAAIDSEVDEGESRVAAIYVPSAEGVATYRGLFGGNGSLSAEEKAHVCRLLQRAIGFEAENGGEPRDLDAEDDGLNNGGAQTGPASESGA